MTALGQPRAPRIEALSNIDFTLASGQIAYQGAALFLDPATGKVSIGGSGSPSGRIYVGCAIRTVDATSADKTIPVRLPKEVVVEFFVNGTASDAVAATDIGKDVFALDDQTVTILPAGRAYLGRVWLVDSAKGVAVEKLERPSIAPLPAVAAFAANDWAPAAVINGAVYDVPTTAGASTITLPAAAQDGTVAYFVADGVKNGHTVTYRDATGPTTLTAALTLGKRHVAVATKLGGKWAVTANPAP